ncbi:helix-turn-helix domain-containing protein [Nitrosomonas cryotolerans]|uniref:helix-turn-helix domain-containing protein n=1 Tax=Nitrosomonas cryotolerans TaxID=44575 RepID=UPI0034E969FA
MKCACKFRFYPTFEQDTILVQTFGCTGFVSNRLLRVRSDAWDTEKKKNRVSCDLLFVGRVKKRA